MAEEFIRVGELSPKSKRVNTSFKVVSLDSVKNVRSKKDRTQHAVTEAIVGDGTGTVLLTLWDDSLEKVTEGKTYQLINGYVTLFKGSIRLNIGKYGEIQEVADLGEVKKDNDVSKKVYDDEFGRRRPYEGFGSGSFWP
ncbi:MAG: single-stranded DNA-binding protein [Candidatus Altiarchaeota archaeon]